MRNYMDFFEQTSKAILFEKFATEDVDGKTVPSLAMFLNEEGVDKGPFHKKVVEKLGVRSFEDFLDKFTPWVYEMIEPGETEDSVEIKYYLEKPDHYDETEMNPTALNATAIYELVNKLYEQRKSSAVPQLNFDFSDIAKVLSPESQTEKIKQARRNMKYYMDEYLKLEEKTPGVQSPEKASAIKMFNENRVAVQDAYTKGSAAMLTLKLGDAGNALLAIGTNNDDESSDAGKSFIGLPEYDADGNLRFKKLEFDTESDKKQIGVNSDQKLLEILQQDYDVAAPEYMKKSPEITNLVLSNISTGLTRSEHSPEFWLDRLQSGQQDYKKWMENLANTIAPLVEKFIGVKAFFENATVDGKLDSVLIVANSTASELTDTDKIKDNLEKFLSNVNREIKKKIWFGIIPAISLGDEDEEESDIPEYDPSNPFGSFQAIKKNKVVKKAELISSADAKILLDICEKVGIMTFYNFKANSKTCFGGIDKDIYEKMKNRIVFENGDYAICCLPNFTIIPEEERNVIINKNLVKAGCQEDYVSLQIPSIYVEASYVAAGMVVGSQQKEMLIKKEFNVDSNLSNIRFDLEGKDVYVKFQSNMCVENDLPVPRDLSEELMKTRFGFYFSDKKIPTKGGKEVSHCYVRNARTMAINSSTNTYDEMTNKLFVDFVEALLYRNEDGADPEYVKEFIGTEVLDWMDYAQANVEIYDNALLKHGEKIESNDYIEISYEFSHAKNRRRLKAKTN